MWEQATRITVPPQKKNRVCHESLLPIICSFHCYINIKWLNCFCNLGQRNIVNLILMCYYYTITDFYPSETEMYVFEENGDSRIQKLFSAQEDNIVEPGLEVFEVFLTTNEKEVVISSPNVSKLFIADDDGIFLYAIYQLVY